MKLNPESLARASSRHPGRTVGIWAVILVAGFVASGVLLSGALTTDFDFTNNPEAIQAQKLLEQKQLEKNVGFQTFILTGAPGSANAQPSAGTVNCADPTLQVPDKVNCALNDLRAIDTSVVQQVPAGYPISKADAANPQTAALGPIVSPDGSAVMFSAIITADSAKTATIVPQLDAMMTKYSTNGTTLYELGEPTSTADFKKISEQDLRKGEGIGILVAIVVLLIVFGSLIAGVTPIIMGIFAIGATFGLVGLIGQFWRFSFFVPNLISMMGLAVGIDYSLFIVSRYREERARGRDNLDAVAMSGATANRAVFFSGITVVIALAGMLLVPTTIFRGLAGGAIMVVLVSVALSMTLLPALMTLFNDRLVKPGKLFGRGRTLEHGRTGGFWDRASRSVMRRPWAWLIVTGTFMVLLSVPFWTQRNPIDSGRGIRTGFSGISTIPDSVPTKQAFNVLVAKFPTAGEQSSTTDVVIPGAATDPTVQQGIATLEAAVANDPAFGKPQAPVTSADGTVTLVRIPMSGAAADTSGQLAISGVENMRSTYVPQAFGANSGVLVGGEPAGGSTATTVDFFKISNFYTPIVIALVLGLSFILLTVVFRSIVVPAKAIVMNLLSVGAAYGLIVLIFQKGGPAWATSFANVFNFIQVDAIEAWLPLFLFSILFGLSMDYQVFLLSRIREEYDKTGDNSEAVAYGLRTTGGIITGAAIIMVAVFAAFASGRIAGLQQMGFGLAVAVFLDATIVRSILVPSAMKLLGDRNWYLPRWLQWLPKVDVEGHAPVVTVPEISEPAGVTE